MFAGAVDYDVLYPTIENAAQIIDSGGIDRLVVPQLINGGAGDAVVFD